MLRVSSSALDSQATGDASERKARSHAGAYTQALSNR